MELWWYINLHKLDLTISNYHIWYLTNSHKTVEYHQLWGRPSAPHPRLWQPPSLLDGRVQSYSPSVFIFFQGRWWTNWAFFGWFIPFYTHKNGIYDGFMMVLWWFIPIPLMVFAGHWMALIVGFTTEKHIENLLSRNRSPMFMTWLRLVQLKKQNRSIHPILLVS